MARTRRPRGKSLAAPATRRLGRKAPRVLVGVDDIPSRWLAQAAASGWLSVAGTSHFTVLTSTHRPDTPCAGCVHPRDDDAPGDIPTISFVSATAGLLQAYDLLAEATLAADCRQVFAAPFNLPAPRAILGGPLGAHDACAVKCQASRRSAA